MEKLRSSIMTCIADLIKARVAAKKRKQDLAMLLVDTSGMDNGVKAWCADHRAMILTERRAPPAPQPRSTAAPATSTPPSSFTTSATSTLATPEEVPSTLVDDLVL
jgi:hypothetical protein